jgi:DNA repair and recombination protein RAD54B
VELPIYEGKNFELSGKVLEVDAAISRADYFSGACFGRTTSLASSSAIPHAAGLSKPFIPPKIDALPEHIAPRRYSTPSERKAIPLQPVDLISTVKNCPTGPSFANPKVEDSHWTANW